MRKSFLFLMVLIFGSYSQSAYAKKITHVYAIADYSLLDTSIPAFSVSYKGRIGFGLGASYEWRNKNVGIEVGLNYLVKKADITSGAITVPAVDFKSLRIPVTAHLYIGKMFSIVGGGYYDLTVTAAAANDFGLIGGLRMILKLSSKWGLSIGAYYNKGTIDCPLYSNAKMDSVQAQVGISFL